MNKEKAKNAFYKYSDFISLQSIGQGIIAQVKQLCPYDILLAQYTYLQVGAWGLHDINWWIFQHIYISSVYIFLFVIIKYYFMTFIASWIMGLFTIKIGLRNAQNQYQAKSEHLDPTTSQLLATVRNIAKKVDAQNEITSL